MILDMQSTIVLQQRAISNHASDISTQVELQLQQSNSMVYT